MGPWVKVFWLYLSWTLFLGTKIDPFFSKLKEEQTIFPKNNNALWWSIDAHKVEVGHRSCQHHWPEWQRCVWGAQWGRCITGDLWLEMPHVKPWKVESPWKGLPHWSPTLESHSLFYFHNSIFASGVFLVPLGLIWNGF